MHNHSVDLVVAHEKILISDRIILRSVTVESIGACGPKIRSEHVQVRYLFSVTRVKSKKVLSSLSDPFNLRTNGYKDSSFVL